MYKRGQITLFIVLGVIVVLAIGTLLVLFGGADLFSFDSGNPAEYFKECVMDSSEEYFNLIKQGGVISPDNYLVYETKQVPFLCYTDELERICSSSLPPMQGFVEQQLHDLIAPVVSSCFEAMKDKFGIEYLGPTNFQVEVLPEKIYLNINRDSVVGNDKRFVEDYSFSVEDFLFNYFVIANEIILKETSCECGQEYCAADVVALTKGHPNYKIRLFVGSTEDRVYSIQGLSDSSENKFVFAVRNCLDGN
jgi:hypothetical protein